MSKKIFKNLIMVVSLVLILSLTFAIGVFGRYVDKITKEQLADDANFLGEFVDQISGQQSEVDYLNSLGKTDKRITLVNKDGSVIFDSKEAADTLENHKSRPEIKEAQKNGIGFSERYSTTLAAKTIYCGVKLKNGDVLRIATKQESIFSVLYNISILLIVIWIIMLLIMIHLSKKISQKIVDPINKMDLDNFEIEPGYGELNPLLLRMKNQKEDIIQKEEELKDGKRELETIVENIKEGLILFDQNGKIMNINEPAIELLSDRPLDREELSDILQVNRNLYLEDNVKEALEGKVSKAECKFNNKYLYITVSPIGNSTSSVAGAMMSVMDISYLVERDNYRREFTANVSHELKTPLTSISGFAELMKDGMVKEEDMQHFSKRIYDETQVLINLVTDILTLSYLDEEFKSKKDGNELEQENQEQVSINQVISKVVGDLEFKGHNADVKIISDCSDTAEGELKVPLRSAYRICYNLVENSIKYNRAEGHIWIKTFQDDNVFGFYVKDDGIGIAPEDMDRIFERFYRADKGRTKSIEGTGLGLSIVKQETAISEGKIHIESEVGKGTKVKVSWKK